MRLRLIIAAVACALAGPAFGQESYRIDPLHTATTFSVSHLGISMQRGSFGRTTGTVMLDRAAGKGSVDVSIDASTVNSGSRARIISTSLSFRPSRSSPRGSGSTATPS